MKKILIYLLIATILLTALVSCGSQKENPATDFEYSVTEDGGVVITKYIGKDLNVVIPAQIDGKNVVAIGEKAFYQSAIKTLAMPDTVAEIDYMAFCECKSLTSVLFSKKLVFVRASAFSDCTSLKSADLSADTLQWIELGAFYNCESLEEVTFGTNVERILALAFGECKSLEKIILPQNLKELGDEAFARCTSATEIFIPKTIEHWGGFAFSETSSVTKISFENGLKTIGSSTGVFSKCQVTELTIPSSVESICNAAFTELSDLENVYFEGNAPAIEDAERVFLNSEKTVTLYYDPATSGWDTTPLRDCFDVMAK